MMPTAADLSALWITLKLAGVSTVILLGVGTPLAWWLAHTKWRFKAAIESSSSGRTMRRWTC